jgi:putative aldouronate transport system substrate-binding protein
MKANKMTCFSWIALFTMVAVLLAGCSQSAGKPQTEGQTNTGTPSTDGSAGKPDTSKKVELEWYLLGDASKDQKQVIDQWNKMLEKDLNTTVKLNFTTWTDWQTKYNLLLASGEKIDMIFASTWADYYKLANQGAFMPLNDLLPTYAPETWKNVPKQDWSEATVKDKIYAVPATYPEYTPDGLVYRDDWRQELGLPEIKDLDTLEAYLEGVKTKKHVTPINGKAYNEVSTLFNAYNDYQQIGGSSGVVVASSYDKPRDIIAYPFTPEFEAWAKRMKTWADKGFWNSDTLSSQAEAGDAIKAGTGAVYWRNAPGAGGFIVDMEKNNPDIKLAYFPFTRFHNYAMPTLSVNNAMAIPKNAANPERSLMVLDKLRNDPKYYDLLNYGIEGKDYSIGPDGKYIVTPPANLKDTKNFVPYSIASWGFRVESMERVKQAAGWSGFDALLKEFKAESKPNIFAPIVMDYAPVKSQQAAVNAVVQQYGMPLMMGLVPDVDKALATYRKQLEAAGINDILDYVKKQAYAYYDEKGIK